MLAVKRALKAASLWLFELGQFFNVFIVPVHYYVPLASTRQLRKSRERWNRPIDLSTLPMNLDSQRECLRSWIAPFESEYRGNKIYLDGVKYHAGPGFGYIEAQALHGFIRHIKPRKIIEIGSGVSTWCILGALSYDQEVTDRSRELFCVDPNPSRFLQSLPVQLHKVIVEDVPLEFFDQLEAGDMLSIDSSHAVRCCGDVPRIYLEILPRLKPGVFVHVHDVMLPYIFPRDVERVYTQSMETALLFAMLANSSHFDVLICLSQLHYADPKLLKEVFPEYDPQPNVGGLPRNDVKLFGDRRHFPSSTYLLVK